MGIVNQITGLFEVGTWGLFSAEADANVRSPKEVTGVRVNYGPQQTIERTLTDIEGSVVPTANNPTSVSLSAVWHADSNIDDVSGIANALSLMAQKDPKLRRRPLCKFDFGPLAMECWVTNLELSFPHGQFPWPPYYFRALQANITLTKAQPRAFEETGKPKAQATSIRRLGAHDSFELQAWIKYSDPQLAVLVRRYNPNVGLDGERRGDVIRLYERDHPDMVGATAPISAAFVGDFAQTLQARAESRIGVDGPGLTELEEELGLA